MGEVQENTKLLSYFQNSMNNNNNNFILIKTIFCWVPGGEETRSSRGEENGGEETRRGEKRRRRNNYLILVVAPEMGRTSHKKSLSELKRTSIAIPSCKDEGKIKEEYDKILKELDMESVWYITNRCNWCVVLCCWSHSCIRPIEARV